MKKLIATAIIPRTDIVVTIVQTGRSTWVTWLVSESFDISVPVDSYTEAEAREMANAFWMDGVKLRNDRENPAPKPRLYAELKQGDKIMWQGEARVVESITHWTVPAYVARGITTSNRPTRMMDIVFVDGIIAKVESHWQMTVAA